jgi:hypothetical protein
MQAALVFLLAFAAAALAPSARADVPVEDMTPLSLGLQYGLSFRGQNITNAKVPSHETIHSLGLAYAPLPYLALEAGLGLDKLSVDSRNSIAFRGDYGFSPSFGLVLASPYFAADLLRVDGGVRGLYLNSEDDRGYRYSGFISNPFLGLVVSPSPYIDVEAGARGHILNGTMQGPGGTDKDFGNGEMVRGYAAFTLKTPYERAYLTVDVDMSPSMDSDWSHGPREAQVGVSFGTILGWQGKNGAAKDSSVYFPAYNEMKARQKKMSEEIE